MRIELDLFRWNAVLKHVLPEQTNSEEAAFLFGRYQRQKEVINVVDIFLASKDDFVAQEIDYLELSDITRSSLIKRAHDHRTCLIEMHSHPGYSEAAFSFADVLGLKETAPHMQWRLREQPYAAIVVTNSSFDALIWRPGNPNPDALAGIEIPGFQKLVPTNHSIRSWR